MNNRIPPPKSTGYRWSEDEIKARIDASMMGRSIINKVILDSEPIPETNKMLDDHLNEKFKRAGLIDDDV